MSIRVDHGEDSLDVVHQINVTPFIDVMLVLLTFFMIAAQMNFVPPREMRMGWFSLNDEFATLVFASRFASKTGG